MQVSDEELQHITDLIGRHPGSDASGWIRLGLPLSAELSAVTPARTSEAKRVVKLVNATPDTRDNILASLQERIEAGTYFVDSVSIAEMIIRRALVDRLR